MFSSPPEANVQGCSDHWLGGSWPLHLGYSEQMEYSCPCVSQLPLCITAAPVYRSCPCVSQLPLCITAAPVYHSCPCVSQLPLCSCPCVSQLPLCIAAAPVYHSWASSLVRCFAGACIYGHWMAQGQGLFSSLSKKPCRPLV